MAQVTDSIVSPSPGVAMATDTVSVPSPHAFTAPSSSGPRPAVSSVVAYADSTVMAVTDTVVMTRADSIEQAGATAGMLIDPPSLRPAAQQRADSGTGLSWALGALILIFCLVALRYHNNRKYLKVLMRDLVEVRERQNAFDETVRETSFMVLLNLLWSCSAGVILYSAAVWLLPPPSAGNSFGINALLASPGACIAICMGVMTVYSGFITSAYWLVGNVFSDRLHTQMWLKGFFSSQGLMTLFFFPLALALVCYPQSSSTLLAVAAVAFVMAKSIFLWKGLRIFFTQFSSWVLFLYYLCSLEIIPLILTYIAAMHVCAFVLG